MISKADFYHKISSLKYSLEIFIRGGQIPFPFITPRRNPCVFHALGFFVAREDDQPLKIIGREVSGKATSCQDKPDGFPVPVISHAPVRTLVIS